MFLAWKLFWKCWSSWNLTKNSTINSDAVKPNKRVITKQKCESKVNALFTKLSYILYSRYPTSCMCLCLLVRTFKLLLCTLSILFIQKLLVVYVPNTFKHFPLVRNRFCRDCSCKWSVFITSSARVNFFLALIWVIFCRFFQIKLWLKTGYEARNFFTIVA